MIIATNTSHNEIEAHSRLIEFLRTKGVFYRVVSHLPEGRSEIVARLRGSRLEQGAKALVFKVGMPSGEYRFVLAVVPANRRVSINKVAEQIGGRRACLAERSEAERLTGYVIGAIPPFTFNSEITLLVDSQLLAEAEIVFNAGCLDKSIFITASAYRNAANPIVCTIIEDLPS